jgi:lysophospholipase L1-like esterase
VFRSRTRLGVITSAIVTASCHAPNRSPTDRLEPNVTHASEGDSGQVDAGAASGQVRWVGRVDASRPEAVRFAWSGAGLTAVVGGAKVSAAIRTENTAMAVFFQPVIDGRPGPRFAVPPGPTRTVVLGEGLAPGDHRVELYRETEGAHGVSVFEGFVEGSVRRAPPSPGRFIEIIGDSISAGYGNLGSEVHPPWKSQCSYSPETESVYMAYGSILARALQADVSTIARSGWGMVRDFHGEKANVLPDMYDNTLGAVATPPWEFRQQPDLVLIDLGSNDSAQGDPGPPFEEAYIRFLHRVRGHYPSAWIFLVIGPVGAGPTLAPMREHLRRIATAMADPKVTTVDVPPQDMARTGCDFHPDVAEDEAMAALLARSIRARLGW